jgi:pimeloyl-ACP methyl ester carboxylesterase
MKQWLLGGMLLLGISITHAGYAEEVRMELNGMTLNANLELAQGSKISDGVVLMTHGTLAHRGMEIMATLQSLFSENGINSLAINLSLGIDDRHGMYDCATPHTHRHTDALDEIGAWLGWLQEQGAERVTLLGHSRGGNQTAWFAAERDEAVIDKILLVAPSTWDRDSSASGYKKRYGKDLKPLLSRADKLIEIRRADTLLAHTDFIYCPDTTVSAAAFVSYYSDEPRMDTPYLLSEVSKPVLVFVGSEDKVVKQLETKMGPLADSGAVRVEIIEGADHYFRDLYAEELIEMAVEFIQE